MGLVHLRGAAPLGDERLLGIGVGRQRISLEDRDPLRFALAYDPMEFTDTLHHIAEGEIDVAPMITGEVGLDGVGGAFAALADPEEHCKILVVP